MQISEFSICMLKTFVNKQISLPVNHFITHHGKFFPVIHKVFHIRDHVPPRLWKTCGKVPFACGKLTDR